MNKYERLATTAAEFACLIGALESQNHSRRNKLAVAESIRHDDQIEELTEQIEAIERAIENLRDQLYGIGRALASI